ncbi:MAG: DUF1189 family protein [Bacillota bacterium]
MSFFEQLKDATVGFSGYARLARDPRGSFGYMAVLLAIVIAINGYINLVQLRRVTAELARQVATWPDFGVRNGEFFFDGPMPFREVGADGTLLVVDTTGQTTPEALAEQRAVLITRERLYLMEPGAQPREFPFSQLQSDLGKPELEQFLRSGPGRLLPFIYLFIYIAQLAFKAVDAVLLALVAVLYSRSMGRHLPFELGFKLALYAMSLPVIIQWVWVDFHSWIPLHLAFWWSLATIYLIFGLRAYWFSTDPEGPLPG